MRPKLPAGSDGSYGEMLASLRSFSELIKSKHKRGLILDDSFAAYQLTTE